MQSIKIDPAWRLAGRPPISQRLKTLRNKHAALREAWDVSRQQSRQMVADAQKLRQQSRDLVKASRLAVAQSAALRGTNRLKPSKPQSTAVVLATATSNKAVVATARRVPWRRLQMQDLDDASQVWVSPDLR